MEIVVVAESVADKMTACGFADRVLSEEAPDWMRDQLDVYRSWRGIESGTEYTKWPRVKELALASNIRVLGHRRDERGGYDYASAKKAIIICLLRKEKDPMALLLVRDMDRQAEDRRRSLCEARNYVDRGELHVLLALPNPMREAWILNGFVPSNDGEAARLEHQKARVGFDPCLAAEALHGRSPADDKSPKRVLAELTNDDAEREERCWSNTSLAVLSERGGGSGLTEFLEEVRKILIPALQG